MWVQTVQKLNKALQFMRNAIKPVFAQTLFQLEFVDRHKRKEKNHDTMHITFLYQYNQHM